MTKGYKMMVVTLHSRYHGADEEFEFEVPVDATEEEVSQVAWDTVADNIEISVKVVSNSTEVEEETTE